MVRRQQAADRAVRPKLRAPGHPKFQRHVEVAFWEQIAAGLLPEELSPATTGWDDVDELELATLSWVHWFNEARLHGHCNNVPPAEYEAAFYAAQEPLQALVPLLLVDMDPSLRAGPP